MSVRSWLVALYPYTWRQRYGKEFGALLEDCRISPLEVLDVVIGAFDARLHPVSEAGSNWRLANMDFIAYKKGLAFVAITVTAAAILDINLMALAAFARLEGMAVTAASIVVAGVAATLGFVAIAARKIHNARARQA